MALVIRNNLTDQQLKDEAVQLAIQLLEQFDELGSYMSQIHLIEIEPMNEIDTMFAFIHPEFKRDDMIGTKVIAEGKFIDKDGEIVDVLLHAQGEYLSEIEYVKYSKDPIVERPIVSKLTQINRLSSNYK